MAILAPQLIGKVHLTYAAMTDVDARDYNRVEVAIFQCYNIKEETYHQHFCAVQLLENKTLVELAIHVKDLVEKWLKDCPNWQDVADVVVKEQFVEVLPEEVKERKPRTTQEAGRLAEDSGKRSCGHQLQSQILEEEYQCKEVVIRVVIWDAWLRTAVVRS